MRRKLLSTIMAMAVMTITVSGTTTQTHAAITPDPWENNETWEDAYPYDLVPVVRDTITKRYDTYDLGMRTANLDSADDVDWYEVSLVAGTRYFVDLRNIGAKNWYTELYKANPQGEPSRVYTTDHRVNPVYKDARERYFYYTPTTTGTYYFKVTSGDAWGEQMNYFFYVGPEEQTFYISNLPTENYIQISETYKSYTFDLRNYVPAESTIVNLSLDDRMITGYCPNLDKRLTAGGRSYYNYTGGTEMRNIRGVKLGQLWTISAKCSSGSHSGEWSARISGEFTCKMKPYTGNELNLGE
ncbi:MAG: hypothetical protein K2M46_09090 [Lachnospiraceae bacterium]|nr:hypothetical protein [Lachnospiraceae bacterium]